MNANQSRISTDYMWLHVIKFPILNGEILFCHNPRCQPHNKPSWTTPFNKVLLCHRGGNPANDPHSNSRPVICFVCFFSTVTVIACLSHFLGMRISLSSHWLLRLGGEPLFSFVSRFLFCSNHVLLAVVMKGMTLSESIWFYSNSLLHSKNFTYFVKTIKEEVS